MKNWKRCKISYLKNLYSHMKERVTHPTKSFNSGGKRIKKYYGLPICKLEEFLEFAIKSKRFDFLFKRYKNSRGKLVKAPSIDRIDNNKGYVVGNMQFLTFLENTNKDRPKKWIAIKNTKTGKIYRFSRTREVSKFLQQRGRVNLKHKSFTNLKNKIKYINLSRKNNDIHC